MLTSRQLSANNVATLLDVNGVSQLSASPRSLSCHLEQLNPQPITCWKHIESNNIFCVFNDHREASRVFSIVASILPPSLRTCSGQIMAFSRVPCSTCNLSRAVLMTLSYHLGFNHPFSFQYNHVCSTRIRTRTRQTCPL